MKARIYLFGPFRVEDATGARVVVRATKVQALLALLVTAPKGERTRSWLQSKLWSDRAPEQAAGSLRQALVSLRKVLASLDIELETDRNRVALDPSEFDQGAVTSGVFLEGLDVRDTAFSAWVQAERDRRSAPGQASPAILAPQDAGSTWAIAILPQAKSESLDRWFESLFSDALSRSLREIFSAPVSVNTEPQMSARLLTVRVESFSADHAAMTLRIVAEHPSAKHQLWAGHRTIAVSGAPPIDHPELLGLVNEMIQAVGDYLILNGALMGGRHDPDEVCRNAIHSLFSMNPDRILDADAQFAQAYDMRARGLYLAWRAQLRAIQSIERHNVDRDVLVEEGRHYCEKALELEPNNSMVLATLANALRRFDRNDDRSLAMARRAVQLNPANPMAWWSVSAANAYAGDYETAFKSAGFARKLAILSPNRFWWDCQMFATAMPRGKYAEALKFAEQSAASNPSFRPPLRYQIALYAAEGRHEEALKAAARLAELEPGFSIEQLLLDDSYPASLLHSSPDLDVARLRALI